jgi:uncharacterized protein with HEPN domain
MVTGKSPRVRLLHILAEINSIEPHFTSVSRDGFLGHYLLMRATERAVLIISEAARGLPETLTDQQQHIDWAAIRSIGNILRHEYHHVQPEILWNIVQDEFPRLKEAVKILLSVDEA